MPQPLLPRNRVVEAAAFIGGFVAAEATFYRTGNRFAFAIAVAAVDEALCELAAETIGVGRVYFYARRQPHFHDEVHLRVQSMRDLIEEVVPFMEVFLPQSEKRAQFDEWKTELFGYWEQSAKRRRPCIVDGCSDVRRAKGLCRRHYYERHRR